MYGQQYETYPMATFTPDGLFVPQPYAAAYFYGGGVPYQGPVPQTQQLDDIMLLDMIKKQM